LEPSSAPAQLIEWRRFVRNREFPGPDAGIQLGDSRDVVGSGFLRVLTRQAGREADAGFAALFNHLIGTAKDRERYVQAERPSAPFLTFVSCCSEGF